MARDDDAAGGFSRIAGGLADLINLLVDLDSKGDLPRRGRREKNGVVVEYSVGGGTADGSPAESAADGGPDGVSDGQPGDRAGASRAPRAAPARRAARRTDIEVIEPVTDLFDEPGETVLLFELPGVGRAGIRCLLDGDILLLDARAEHRLYRKEVLIEARLSGEPPRLELRNGVLEVRLAKAS
jgi:HSP20 family molecular chaperone IbpA